MREPSQIGDRMKRNYEDITRQFLPRRTYTIIRVDGKAFHTWTRGLTEPFDEMFMSDMNQVAIEMCRQLQGCRLAFLQSDEISFLLTDFERLETDAWFGGELRKLCSISASMAGSLLTQENPHRPPAFFDGRAFTIPSRTEVMNYFVYRQQDASRNSVQMVAQHYYSQKELNGRNTDQMQEMIHQKGDNWNDYPVACRRGRLILPTTRPSTIDYMDGRTDEKKTTTVDLTRWVPVEPTIFTKDRQQLQELIPPLPDDGPEAYSPGNSHPMTCVILEGMSEAAKEDCTLHAHEGA